MNKLQNTQDLMKLYGQKFLEMKGLSFPKDTTFNFRMSGNTYLCDFMRNGKIFGQVYSPLGDDIYCIFLSNGHSYDSRIN